MFWSAESIPGGWFEIDLVRLAFLSDARYRCEGSLKELSLLG